MRPTKNITNNKLQDTEKSIDKIKETFKTEIGKLKKDNDGTNNKLRILYDRSGQDSLRFDGIKKWDEECWVNTEPNLKDTLTKILGIQNIKIKITHLVVVE